MKRFFWLWCLPLSLFASEPPCQDALKLTDETQAEVMLCRSQEMMVSQQCAQEQSQCALIKDWKKKKPSIKSPMNKAFKRNPGSWACEELGWKVIMAKNFDGSDTCLCEHPTKERVACTSLIQ